MIFTDRKITIRNSKSTINEPVILYRGDYEVSIKFTIMESKFRFKSGVNLVDSEKASHGQLAILTPYGGNVFSEIVKCEDGTVTFTLTKEMIDQLEEVGLYSFQIRLFDYYRESRVSIPPVEFGIEVREPVASEDHDNEVNNAIVGYSIAKVVDPSKEDVGDTFDADGQYNKTDWETGDRITEGKLNKIEDAIDKINQNEKKDMAALDKRITNNFNVLNSNKADKNAVFSMANMGQDVKEAMTGGSVAVVGRNVILNENIVNDQVSVEKIDFCNIEGNLIDLNKLISDTCIIQYTENFGTQSLSGYSTTHKIIVEPNTTYTIEENTINGILFNEYDINGKKLVYRHFSILKVPSLTFTTTQDTRYIIISFKNTVKNNVYFNRGDSIIKKQYSINFNSNVNVVKKEELNEIKEKVDMININNIDYNYFAQIKNGFLICNIPSTTKVSYNGLDIGDTGRVHKFLVQLAFENKPIGNPATATLISTKLGYRYVSNITDKSLHICFGQDSMHVDLFDNGVMNIFGNYTYSTPCLKDGKTLYKIGWEYVDEDNVKIYMPDGTTQNFTMPNSKKVSDYAGRYNIIEHFTENNNGTNISGAMFKKIALWRDDDTYRPLIFDDFGKADGSIGVTRSGHIYHQMLLNNSNYTNF